MIKLTSLLATIFILWLTTDNHKENNLTSPTQEKEATVKLPVSKWVIVLKGVAKLPLEESQDVYMSIVTQINSQMQDSTKKK